MPGGGPHPHSEVIERENRAPEPPPALSMRYISTDNPTSVQPRATAAVGAVVFATTLTQEPLDIGDQLVALWQP